MILVKMKPNKDKVAFRLKTLRSRLGYTIEQMAERLNLSKGTFNSYLRGLALPPENIIDKLVEITNVTKEWIYYGDERDIIEDIIVNSGYRYFYDEQQIVIEEIVKEYKGRVVTLKQNIGFEDKSKFEHKIDLYNRLAEEIILKHYKVAFYDYVKTILSDYINEINTYPLYRGEESNGAWFLNRIIDSKITDLKYGDYEEIRYIAKEDLEFCKYYIFDKVDGAYTGGPTLLSIIISKLKSEEETIDLLNDFAHVSKASFNPQDENGKILISAFRGMLKNLDQ